MPFSGFDDFADCKRTMMDEEGHDADSAESICGALQAEAKADNGDPEELLEAVKEGAGLIADVGVDLVSGVDVPAIDSRWVAMKSTAHGPDGSNYRVNAPLLKADREDDTEERRISYAAAMIPRELDKEGDVAPTHTVEKAAHDFLTQAGGGGVDTDHSLIDGEGEVIESWVLKDDRTFDLPGGGSETYPAGTWMVGIKWGADAWSRIKTGELTGLSIYGMAEHVDLRKDGSLVPRQAAKGFEVPFADEVVVHVVYESQTAAEKASERMGLGGDIHEHTLDGMDVFMPGATHDDFVQAYNELAREDDDMTEDDTDDEVAASATTKDDEDPCWEGYTMVGLDENGDPRCVPDDEVPDADFSESLTPAETKARATQKGGTAEATAGTTKADAEGSRSMGDGIDTEAVNDAGGGPDVGTLAERLDSLESTVKDALEADKQPGSDLGPFLSNKAEEIANREDVDKAPDQIKAELEELLRMDGDGDEDMADEDEDEDEVDVEVNSAAKRADDANLAKGGDGRTAAAEKTAAVKDADGSGTLSYKQIAAEYEAGN